MKQPENKHIPKKKLLKIVVLILSLGIVTILFYSQTIREAISPSELRASLLELGMAAPLVYIIFYITLVIFFFPASALSAVGGFVFGAFFGTVYTIIAATAAAIIAFVLGQWLGKDFVQHRLGNKLKDIDEKISGKGFWSMIILRLLFLPYIPLSYAAGLTRISLRDFALATFLTNIPGSFAFTYLGSSLNEPKQLLFAIILIAIVMCIPLTVKYYNNHKKKPTA
ncbi:MAG: VTT domain-containing protein [Nanoarchaeota archaeon]|mgnify:CR=1 FL=1